MKMLFLSFIFFFLLLTASSCGDKADYEEDGRDAASAFCDCLAKGNSKSKCEENLKDKYARTVYTHEDFIKNFNVVGAKCNVSAQRW